MHNIKKILKSITIFDKVIFIIFLFTLFVVFTFFYRKSEYVNIRVKVSKDNIFNVWANPNPLNWYADRFVKGDVERDILGRVISEIVNTEIFSIDNRTKIVYLDLKVIANYDTRTKTYAARGKRLVFGTPVRFTLSGITFDGIVTDIQNSALKQNIRKSRKNIDVLVRGIQEYYETGRFFLEPKVIESVRTGDKISNSNGEILAEVINAQVYPSERITQDDNANLYLKYDPLYKDSLITLNVMVKSIENNKYIFEDTALRLGSAIPLAFNDVFLTGIIVRIED